MGIEKTNIFSVGEGFRIGWQHIKICKNGMFLMALRDADYAKLKIKTDHLFVTCCISTIIKNMVCSWCNIPSVLADTMQELLEIHKKVMVSKNKTRVIQLIILTSCSEIWKARNELIFSGKRIVINKIFGEIQTSFLWAKHKAKRNNLEWRNWITFNIVE
ncbi:hypothetical protein HanRHA438_Chr07g0318711 [Helianthus annuus]|nr:hypothetical protein HanIR_Chr07g0334431 [Helianthus annuus]KAJ0909182.1 hypothetical protein HanRHA438_Chr07g0318711 [Helianthus annuus]